MREANPQNSERITITVSRLGGESVTIDVRDGTTVEQALNCAGFDLRSGETVYCDGKLVKMDNYVDEGDSIQLIGRKEGGNEDDPETAEPVEEKSEDEEDEEEDEEEESNGD